MRVDGRADHIEDYLASLHEGQWFGFKNLNMGPRIEKVVLNMGLGLDGNDSKIHKSVPALNQELSTR